METQHSPPLKVITSPLSIYFGRNSLCFQLCSLVCYIFYLCITFLQSEVLQLILLVVAFSYLPCLEGSSPPSCTCFGSFQPATSFCFSSQLLKHPPPFLCLDFTAPWPFLFGMFSVMLFHSQLKISSFFSFQMSVFLKMHVFLGILFFCTILSDFEPTNFSACTPPHPHMLYSFMFLLFWQYLHGCLAHSRALLPFF